jgi:uncharacterized protein
MSKKGFLMHYSILIFLFSFFVAFSPLKGEENPLKASVQSLKLRQPDWRFEILEWTQTGDPQRMRFFDKEGRAVKELTFFDNGQLKSEVDFKNVSEGSEGYQLWGSTSVPHGTGVFVYESGEIEKVAHYDEGILDGEVRIYYPQNKLQGICHFDQGKRAGVWLSYFENGVVGEETEYVDDLLHGERKRYYPSGAKASLARYDKGVAEGIALEWYESGALKSSRQYVNGKLHSTKKNCAFIQYNEAQSIIEVKDYKDGDLEGTHICYWPNGKESYKVSYQAGLKKGKEKYFDEKGKLIGEGEYREGVKIGRHWKDHLNGQPALRAEYTKEGEMIAPAAEYDEHGFVIREFTLVGDEYDGNYLEYYPTGQLKIKYHYALGKLDGEQVEYYLSGKMKRHYFMKEGKESGTHRAWYEGGQLAFDGGFIDGLKQGTWSTYNEEGVQLKSESFHQDQYDGFIKIAHPNGVTYSEGAYRLGKPEGLHRMWYESEILAFEGNYISGEPDGEHRWWGEKGEIQAIERFVEGKREGVSEQFYPNGNIRMSVSHRDGVLDGISKGLAEDGSLISLRTWRMGVPVGEQLKYYLKGQGRSKEPQIGEVSIFDEQGRRDGEQKTYFASGKLQSVTTFSHGELNGKKAIWDSYGNLVEEAYYENGKLNGRFFGRDQDGKEIIYHFVDNRREGKHFIFYPPNEETEEKVKAIDATFINDKLEGDFFEYDPEGYLLSTVTYQNGLKEGIAKAYAPNGKVIAEISIQSDKKEGPSLYYFSSGKIYRELFFINDLQEGEEKIYFENGKPESFIEYRAGKKEGKFLQWNEAGILIFEGEYRDGKREGKFNKYYDDGSPKLLQTFVNDELDGVKRSFDPKGKVTETRYSQGKKVS